MAESFSSSQSNLDPDEVPSPQTEPESTVGPPRWVKVFGIIALLIVVAVIVTLLLGGGPGGGHGPGRHSLSGADQPFASRLNEHRGQVW